MTLGAGVDRVEVPVAHLVWERGESWQPPETPQEFAGEKPTLARYFRLGFGHVLDGYDHLAFVLGLVLMVRRFRTLAITITAFTIAHSVTLGLSAADLVFVPAAWTEPLIALSILYVGAENLVVLWRRWRRPGTDGNGGLSLRWVVAFVFGLVHGFGFSYLLRTIGLPDDAFLLSLAAFNIGVEAAQLTVVALPFVILSRLPARPHAACAGIGSLAVAAVGAWWLAERLTG
jgi:hydrogenase/urease accessory protein HupE